MKETVEETEEGGFEVVSASDVSRRERRSRLRFYKKELEKWMTKKPSVDIETESKAKQEQGVKNLRGWGTRYMTLVAKINEYESKRNR